MKLFITSSGKIMKRIGRDLSERQLTFSTLDGKCENVTNLSGDALHCGYEDILFSIDARRKGESFEFEEELRNG